MTQIALLAHRASVFEMAECAGSFIPQVTSQAATSGDNWCALGCKHSEGELRSSLEESPHG